ncbi:hypothetical protein M758_8G158400 [Ceratodon purpureus]|nr:hypothetical protein M758_8G158400 [Ceratodon purpureus]
MGCCVRSGRMWVSVVWALLMLGEVLFCERSLFCCGVQICEGITSSALAQLDMKIGSRLAS